MITRFKTYEARIKWYSKGKFSEEESTEEVFDDVFKIGDHIKNTPKETSCYWDDNNGGGLKENLGVRGKWVKAGNTSSNIWINGKVLEIDTCENVDGYTGQIIKISGFWPWFQTTNLVKV